MRGFTHNLKAFYSILLLALLITGCKTGETSDIESINEQKPVAGADEWLNNLIFKLRQEESANPPAKIYRYTYQDNIVYYLSGRCCDIPSKLYDKSGTVICEPDGGITGRGDGRCPDFFEKRTDETLIWEDNRE